MDYLLALEGGGTRSQAVVVDAGGRPCGSAQARDVNTNFTSLEEARATVREAVVGALAAARVDGVRIDLLVSALVGPRFGPETFGDLLPRAEYRYYSESQVVFARGKVYRPHGVGLVAATGATAWAVRADDGRHTAFGGWGSLLGDEGSAHALGVAMLRAAGRVWEGRIQLATRIPQALAAHFGFDPADFRNGMVERAYHPPLTRADIAALAPLATRLAEEGDELAACLVAKTAADLSALALHAARSLFAENERFEVVAAGGMINAGPLILEPLWREFRAAFPQVEVRVGLQDPAISLAQLARHDLGLSQEDVC
jgi:N-acetylglucosamine kinase-like BadF-type ATPase